jgi:tryptophanyl-tRNA synthetase
MNLWNAGYGIFIVHTNRPSQKIVFYDFLITIRFPSQIKSVISIGTSVKDIQWKKLFGSYYRHSVTKASRLRAMSYGFLGYPISQAADILIVRPDLVPVGDDNVPHVEQTREIARTLNGLFKEVFPIPEVMVGEVPRLPGLDGQKMSKSKKNYVDPTIILDHEGQMHSDGTLFLLMHPGCPPDSMKKQLKPERCWTKPG